MESSVTSFSPNMYSDVPLYNIQAVAAATGVPAITLRSWERRYGIPQPHRDPKGYRLYSDRDIAVTRWLKVRVQQGVGISRAVNMLRVLETGDLDQPPPPTLDFDSLRFRLFHGVQRMDEHAVSRVIGEALMVAPVEEVALKLLQPVLYTIGEFWEAGTLSITTEHVGSNLLRSHIAQLIRISPPAIRDDQILVGCAPGELHDIGALILALFLRRRGYDVIYVGANIETDHLIADVERLQPAAVCLSANSRETARAIHEIGQRMEHRYGGTFAFGGHVFNEHPDVRGTMPGTYLGTDAAEGTHNLERMLGRPLSAR